MAQAALKAKTNGEADALGDPTNDAFAQITASIPYIAQVRIEGVAPILFHRWSNEAVAEKAKAAKGSKAKKEDDLESYVYRCANGHIGIPGEYLRGAVVAAGRWRQDPRSPRKSMIDLLKAAVVPLTDCADLGKANWDYLDSRRVTIQRSAITRVRPAFMPGWQATFELMVNVPEYVDPSTLNALIAESGRLVGIADFRPTFGRYQVVSFKVTS